MVSHAPPAAPYPAFLRLEGRPVLLVGGGAVALQKAISLGEAGARLTVVAPDVHPDMKHVPGVRKILRRPFKASDLKGAGAAPRLVVAATDDEALNARVARAAERARIWVNVVDRPALCTFIVPAVVRQGQVTFAVSTGGSSPVLARFLAGRIGMAFGPEVAEVARLLGKLRPLLKTVPMALRTRLIEKALSSLSGRGFRPKDVERMEGELMKAVREASHGRP